MNVATQVFFRILARKSGNSSARINLMRSLDSLRSLEVTEGGFPIESGMTDRVGKNFVGNR